MRVYQGKDSPMPPRSVFTEIADVPWNDPHLITKLQEIAKKALENDTTAEISIVRVGSAENYRVSFAWDRSEL